MPPETSQFESIQYEGSKTAKHLNERNLVKVATFTEEKNAHSNLMGLINEPKKIISQRELTSTGVSNVLRQRKIRQFQGPFLSDVKEVRSGKRVNQSKARENDVVVLKPKEMNFEGLGSHLTLNPVASQKILYSASKSLLMNCTQDST